METLAISVFMAIFASTVAPIPWLYRLKYKHNPYPLYDYKTFLAPSGNQPSYGPQQQAIASAYLNCNRPVAISFCMDGQISRTTNEWSHMINLVSSLVDRLSLFQRGLLVSAFSYGYTITHQIKPTSQLFLFKLLVSGIPRPSYGGNTALCLKTSRYYMSKITTSVYRIIVVLTGASTLNTLHDMTEGLYARQSGILVFGVGIGGASPSLPHVVTSQRYMYRVPSGAAGLISPQLANNIIRGICGGIPLGQAARSTPVPIPIPAAGSTRVIVPAAGTTPVPISAGGSTPAPVPSAVSTSVPVSAAGSTPAGGSPQAPVPAAGSTPVPVSVGGSTPVLVHTAGSTKDSVPAAESTPVSVSAAEITPFSVSAAGSTPVPVPEGASSPAFVSAAESTSVPLPAGGSTLVPVPAAGSTRVLVPAAGTTPAPVSAGRSAPAPVPAVGSTPVSTSVAGSTPVPVPAGGSTPAPVPSAVSTPVPVSAAGGTPAGGNLQAPVPAAGSTPVPVSVGGSTPVLVHTAGSTKDSVPAAGSTSVSAPAAGSTQISVPATQSTPVSVSAAEGTPFSLSAAGGTPVPVPEGGSSPAFVSAAESTSVPLPAGGSTPVSVSAVGSTPIPVSATRSTPVIVLPDGSTPVPLPAGGSTPDPVPAAGSTPVSAPAAEITPVFVPVTTPGSTPIPVPAGSTPFSVHVTGSTSSTLSRHSSVTANGRTPVLVLAAGSSTVLVPAAVSTPKSVTATGRSPVSVPAARSTSVPASTAGNTSVPAPAAGSTPLSAPAEGGTPLSVSTARSTPVPSPAIGTTPVSVPATGSTTDHISRHISVTATGSTEVPVSARVHVTSKNTTVPETASTPLSVIKSKHTSVYVPTSQRTTVPSTGSGLTYTSGPQSLIGVTRSSPSTTAWTYDGTTKVTSPDLTDIVDSLRRVSSLPATLSDLCLGCIVIAGFGFNPYPGDCSKYVQCAPKASGWTAFLRECSLGQFWSQDALTCAPAETVTCSSDPCIATGRDARVSVGGNCRTYYECVDGRVRSASCCQESQILVNGRCVASSSHQCNDVCLYNRTQSISAALTNANGTCQESGYRGLPNNKTMYEQRVTNDWIPRPCPPNTVFSEAECTCVRNNHIFLDSAGSPCSTFAYIPFRTDTLDKSGNERNTMAVGVDIMFPGSKGYAYFSPPSHMVIWSTSNMEFGHFMKITFLFRHDSSNGSAGQYTIMGNCFPGDRRGPSIYIGTLIGYNQSIVASLDTSVDVNVTDLSVKYDGGWQDVTVIYDGNTFSLAVGKRTERISRHGGRLHSLSLDLLDHRIGT
ncbi:mucin-5AC-like isoform X2 [Haliotis asinina]|uniref:mucin-5AC-like isoform X2 n=1 Tax=Haliotis asinina TaxID=109174 RepID=UPI003531AE12